LTSGVKTNAISSSTVPALRCGCLRRRWIRLSCMPLHVRALRSSERFALKTVGLWRVWRRPLTPLHSLRSWRSFYGTVEKAGPGSLSSTMPATIMRASSDRGSTETVPFSDCYSCPHTAPSPIPWNASGNLPERSVHTINTFRYSMIWSKGYSLSSKSGHGRIIHSDDYAQLFKAFCIGKVVATSAVVLAF